MSDEPQRTPSPLDNLVVGFDRAMRTLSGQVDAVRESPAADLPDGEISPEDKAHIVGLMRVNHTGEICAQALYEGQALTAKSEVNRQSLQEAAAEERDHLAWCRKRIKELEGQTSVLDPVFYGASFVIGAVTGLIGDRVSLGFVEATEDQVVAHLDRHLKDLPAEDQRSRAIIEQMRADEARHGDHAIEMGGQEFPKPIKAAMTVLSKVMTETTYRV